ncbi:MAG: rod shape-determining protein MreC [Bdellovibrionota bacterium]
MLFSRFFRRNRPLLFKVLLFLSPVVPLLLVKAPEMPALRIYDRIQSWIVHPMAEVVTQATEGASFVWQHYFMLVGASKENETLKHDVENLESQLLGFEELRSENSRLKQIVAMPELPALHTVAGEIIGQDPSGESLAFFINVGRKHGIKERMPVISPQGIVGTITRVHNNYSMFMAVQDPAHAVDGMILRSRAQFITEGRGLSLTGRLKYLDRSADVRVGDLVVTSGLDKVFPKGLKIGFIIKVDRPRTGVMQNAELRPSADLSYLEEVLVVLNQKETSLAAPVEVKAQ